MSESILAIDQGTTNTKALLIDASGAIVARGSVPTGVHYPRPGWVEQDPDEIWRCTLDAVAQCLAGRSDPPSAIAISNQRETALIWDRASGLPLGPAIVWQCRRTVDFCETLKAQGLESLIQARTGLQVDPMFSASKFRWLLGQTARGQARAEAGELCLGNVDAWLLWHLTGGAVHATDLTNASRTQLLNLQTLDWDDELLALFGVPRAALPTLRPSGALFGATVPVALPGGGLLPSGIPIAGMIGDSHASLYGLGGFRPGSVKATYGTGTSLMTPTPTAVPSAHGLSTTVAWAQSGHASQGTEPIRVTYALEGNITTTGGAVQWVGELLGLHEPGPAVEALAHTVEDAGGVVFVPALVGLGAPHWAPTARGTVTGLTLGTGPAHLARAALDAIAFQVRDVFDIMRAEAGMDVRAGATPTLLADGGASRNDLLMQLQADILGCPVERSRSSEISPLGAAFLAGLSTGLWADEREIAGLVPPRDRFEPRTGAGEREARYAEWQAAVARTLAETDV